jgi:RimJ/RimL family protein N-acetyltransferase
MLKCLRRMKSLNRKPMSNPAHSATSNPSAVSLREVIDSDLPILFEQQLDPEANHMAAFTARNPADRQAFNAHWAKIRADPAVTLRTILCDGQVAGSLVCFPLFGQPSVGYWLGRSFWGRGIATRALGLFLALLPTRPLFARAASDNLASIRVLQKCGFVLTGEDRGFAQARGQEIAEVILELR